MGCRYCMLGCPYGIPHYQWDSAAPSVRKCIMCYPNLKSGKISEPACVTACPQKATIFGTRDAMLAEARKRLEAEPGKYVQTIWGEHEVGGTSVLLIADIPLDFLALNPGTPARERAPAPEDVGGPLARPLRIPRDGGAHGRHLLGDREAPPAGLEAAGQRPRAGEGDHHGE